MKKLAQLFRFARVTGFSVGHAAWVAVLSLPAHDKYLIVAAAVGATETAFRQVVPPNKLAQYVKDLQAAYKFVQAAQTAQTGK